MTAQKIPFNKYEAAGNDFIIIDSRHEPAENVFTLIKHYQKYAKQWCDRHFGIGADGLLVMTKPGVKAPLCHAAMHVINADGSIAAMCGNGIRCAARWFYEHTTEISSDNPLSFDTLGGVQTVQCLEIHGDVWMLEVAMARAEWKNTCCIEQEDQIWSGQCIDVGNPHAVFEIQSSPQTALEKSGAFLSHHPIFPDRCNIEFIREIAPATLEMTVYERGVGPTLACGTGCVASAVAYAKSRGIKHGRIELNLPGGQIYVVIQDPKSPLLQGPARHVFDGVISIESL